MNTGKNKGFIVPDPQCKKYLLFSMSRRNTGTDNVFTMLNRVFREARHLGRIPAIGKFTVSPAHNLGNIKQDFLFEDYLNLSNGVIYKLEDGCHRPVESHLEWIKEEALDLESYFFDKIYILADDEVVTEEMNRHYDVLVRRDPTFRYAQTHRQNIHDNISIDFPHSEKVIQLADEVLATLGTSRGLAMAAQRYLLSEFRGVESCADIFLNNGYYACMHVRASIDDRDYGQPIFTFSSLKTQIEAVLNEAITKGTKLYIMSDIHQSDFFDFLKTDYQIYRYHDFPNLKRLTSGENGFINNVMLYLVEKNIMKHALVKIIPPHKGPMIYHINTVYNLSLLKNPPVIRSRPTKTQRFISDCMQKLSLKRIFRSRATR